MEEPLAIPASISYRQLQNLAQSAPADATPISASSDSEMANLDNALEAWSRASQQLLQTLQQAGPAVAEGRGPRQLMALGALQAHVAMGLQALASSRRPQG
ncbi:hypothetical protein [Synechococcus sp. CBW1004]|jgi:hypothetical protein|uniref:hypothetical protein n=1 Tax=Synechococcus sp. CBW1004 TaxID=1353136 RepID=UPI0018CE5CD7|nr:hypothetical protein [Synechococcus sp. CBW1004]QPN63458.1 hypothetical protein H8F25_00685 [Synechococcus sp. CBW1004]